MDVKQFVTDFRKQFDRCDQRPKPAPLAVVAGAVGVQQIFDLKGMRQQIGDQRSGQHDRFRAPHRQQTSDPQELAGAFGDEIGEIWIFTS